MLSEVVKLCNGDFSKFQGKWVVYQCDLAGKSRIMTFTNEKDADEYINLANETSKGSYPVIFEKVFEK